MKFMIKCDECGKTMIEAHEITKTRKEHLFGVMDQDVNDQYVMKGDLIIKFDMCQECYKAEMDRDVDQAWADIPETDEEMYQMIDDGPTSEQVKAQQS